MMTIHSPLLAQLKSTPAEASRRHATADTPANSEGNGRERSTGAAESQIFPLHLCRALRTHGRTSLDRERRGDPDGLLRRLVAEDGKPLSADRAAAEDRRIAALVADPSALRAENADRRADEARMLRLLNIMPQAFLFTTDGMQDDCMRIAFRPNSAFTPSTYDERIVHGLAGIVLVRMPAERLCGIEGHLVDRVSFGFGLLGHIDQGSHFGVSRVPVTAMDWKSSKITVHVDGKILLLKSISRDQDATHSNAEPLPPNLSLAQAAALTQHGSPWPHTKLET